MEYHSNEERLVAEQAVLCYRAVQQAMGAAPHGRGLEVTEQAAVSAGREQTRKMLELLLSAQPEAQKRGRTDIAAKAVKRACASSRLKGGT